MWFLVNRKKSGSFSLPPGILDDTVYQSTIAPESSAIQFSNWISRTTKNKIYLEVLVNCQKSSEVCTPSSRLSLEMISRFHLL